MHPDVTAFFHQPTFSVSYVVREPTGRRAAIIDSILDFEPTRAGISSEFADRIVAFVRENGLMIDWHLETHIHADHLTAVSYLKERLGGQSAIGDRVPDVQRIFAKLYNLDPGSTGSAAFDRLLADGERLAIGQMPVEVLHTPGHTPACVSYRIGDSLFCGDTVFMPDYGTARCDFPGGSARQLYRSIQRLFALPDDLRLFVGHDYGPNGRPFVWETSVAAQRQNNIHVGAGQSEETFVALRETRDKTLALPALMLAVVQMNILGGRPPKPESNGVAYLKIPLNSM
jgi:glyoxylase-like metal-dependent hydrolase (beta-lactamase superfamily II)